MQLASLPAVGQPLEGGCFAGITTLLGGTHHAVVLLPDKPLQDLNWDAAMKWAAELGAGLPTRAIAAMLFALLPAEFEESWHWTCDDDGSGAWYQVFYDGFQGDSHKSYEGRARAVRLIQLTT